jgi:hypothetical protein
MEKEKIKRIILLPGFVRCSRGFQSTVPLKNKERNA